MKKITKNEKMTIQLILAVILALAGMSLLYLGFYAIPVGEISASVLTAFGEVATFAASLMGIDYRYRYKIEQLEKDRSSTEAQDS